MIIKEQQPYNCPACNGAGKLNRPPWIAGDQMTFESSNAGPWPCNACKGTGIIWNSNVSDR